MSEYTSLILEPTNSKIESIFNILIPKKEVIRESLKTLGISYIAYRIVKHQHWNIVRDHLLVQASKY